jgi:hypothetical protein
MPFLTPQASAHTKLRYAPNHKFIWKSRYFGIPRFAFSILMFYTIRMKTNSSENKDQRWLKTPVANLVRHVQSGNYYARIRVRGKLIWKSLKTDRITVAKLRLSAP